MKRIINRLAVYVSIKIVVCALLYGYFFVWHRRRIKVSGKNRINGDQSVLYYAKHGTAVDPPLLQIALFFPQLIFYPRRMPFIPASEEVFSLAFFSRRLAGQWPVLAVLYNRIMKYGNNLVVKNGRRDPAVLKEMVNALKAGRNILIFPEGTRVPGLTVGEFKGGLSLLVRKGEPRRIVPVWIGGADGMADKKGQLPKWKKNRIRIRVGKDIRSELDYLLSDSEDLDRRDQDKLLGLFMRQRLIELSKI